MAEKKTCNRPLIVHLEIANISEKNLNTSMFLPEKIYASLVSRLVLTAAIKFHIEIQPPLIILYEI